MTEPAPRDPAGDLERWAEGLQRQAQRYNQLQDRMQQTSVTERSGGGEITVTVDANGVLTGLELNERTRSMEPSAVASEVMACTRRAQARLRDQITDLVHDTVGDDRPGNNIAQQYADRFPDPAPEQAAAEAPGHLDIGGLPDEQPPSPQREPQRRPPRPRAEDDDDDGFGGSVLR